MRGKGKSRGGGRKRAFFGVVQLPPIHSNAVHHDGETGQGLHAPGLREEDNVFFAPWLLLAVSLEFPHARREVCTLETRRGRRG
jgi:hypothetical protein